MAEPRKIFRIEQTAAMRIDPRGDDPQGLRHAEIMQELGALRVLLAAAPAAEPTARGTPISSASFPSCTSSTPRSAELHASMATAMERACRRHRRR